MADDLSPDRFGYTYACASVKEKAVGCLGWLYESVLSAAEAGECIPGDVVATLLKEMGNPKYSKNHEEKLRMIFEIELLKMKYDVVKTRHINVAEGSLHEACLKYHEQLSMKSSNELTEFEKKMLVKQKGPDKGEPSDSEDFYEMVHEMIKGRSDGSRRIK